MASSASSSTATAAPSANGSSSAPPDGRFLQVVDGEGHFSPTESALSSLVTSTLPSPSSASYSVIGIMGAQSGGKSTLLNLLFGCHFRMMDATSGRAQTTKGVWLDSGDPALSCTLPSPSSPFPSTSLIVMDLEGTDSGERGEDRTTFERQTSLFALSLSSLLILNLWETDIGRYTASNYGILKTVFEVNLSLFAPSTRTAVLFLIRDHIEADTPLTSLQVKLRAEVDRIWADIRKPAAFAQTSVDSLFSFHFAALPHMKLQRAEFDASVVALRDRFLNPANPAFLLADLAGGEKGGVPGEGFGVYVRGIWETIAANKELSLPSQKEMLATYRCDEIIGQQVGKLVVEVRERRETERWLSEYCPTFSHSTSQFIRAALHTYDELTSHYHPDIVAKKRVDLITRCTEVLEEVFNAQATFLLNDSFSAFTNTLSASLLSTFSHGKDVPDDFYAWVKQAEGLSLEYFDAHGGEISVDGVEGLRVEGRREELVGRMEERVAKERAKVLSLLDGILEARAKALLTPTVTVTLKKAPSSLWQDLLTAYQSTLSTLTVYLTGKAQGYRMSERERSGYLAHLEQHLLDLVRTSVEQHSALIMLHMRKRFDRLFRYDEDGFVRKWKGSDDVRGQFKDCQAEALTLLDLFATFQLPSLLHPNTPPSDSDILIPAPRRAQLEAEFPDEVEGALREAEAEQERIRESRRIPVWGLALIAFLGFDDFLALVRNPLLLALVVLLGGVGWVMWTSGMLGPVMMVVGQGVRYGLRWLEQNGVSVSGLREGLAGAGVPVGEQGPGVRVRGGRGEQRGQEVELAATGRSAVNGDVVDEVADVKPSHSVARQRLQARHAKAATITNPNAVAAELERANSKKGL